MKWIVAALLLSAWSGACAQDSPIVGDSKQNHWMYESIWRLRAEGYSLGLAPNYAFAIRLHTRSEFAGAANKLTDELASRLDYVSKEVSKDVKTVNYRIRQLQTNPKPTEADLQELHAVVKELLDVRAVIR